MLSVPFSVKHYNDVLLLGLPEAFKTMFLPIIEEMQRNLSFYINSNDF